MSVVTLTLVGTVASNWTSTPPTAEASHHTLINESVLDTANYLSCGADGKEGEFIIDDLPEGFSHITEIEAILDLAGINGVNEPALHVELRRNGAVIGFYTGGANTGGVTNYEEVVIVSLAGLSIPRNEWNSTLNTIYWKSLDGDAGYPDFFNAD